MSRQRDAKNLIFWIQMLLLFAATSAFSQTEGSWQTTNLGGIHYAVDRDSLAPDRWRAELQHSYECLDPCIISLDASMSAVFLRYKWAQLNPKQGVYDFSDLGAVLDTIHASGKMATLEIMAGKYTPYWVFQNGADHIETRAKENGDYSQEFVPLPWDPIFVAAYKDMIEDLAKFLHQKPDRYNTVVMLKNGGVVVHSGETRLMPTDAFQNAPDKNDQRAVNTFRKALCQDWAQSGYSERNVLLAVKTMNSLIDTAFPDKYIGLAFVAGSGEFSTVDENGQCTFPERNETLDMIVKQTVISYGARAVINSTVLTDEKGNPPIMKWVVENSGKIGFQLNKPIVGCGEGSPSACDPEKFKRSVQAGIVAGATYIEVFNDNLFRFRNSLPELNAALAAN